MENTFKIGDKAFRKGRECKIVSIDNSLQPPAFTVLMLDTNTEVGTELKYISKTPIKKKQKQKKQNKHKRKKRGKGLLNYLLN